MVRGSLCGLHCHQASLLPQVLVSTDPQAPSYAKDPGRIENPPNSGRGSPDFDPAHQLPRSGHATSNFSSSSLQALSTMDVLRRRKSSVTSLGCSPTSPIISCGRDHLSDNELALRWKLLDAQRQRGKIAQSLYEAKQQDLLRFCSNDDFRDLVLKNFTRLAEGEIDHVGYDKRVRFLCDKLGGLAPLSEAYEPFEERLKTKERRDKKSHNVVDDPRSPKDPEKPLSPEVRSPEEEKFFASPIDQGWTFDTEPRTRKRSSDSVSSVRSAASDTSSIASRPAISAKGGKRTKTPYSYEPQSPEEQKFFASDADQGWTFETEPRTRKRSSDSISNASYASANYSYSSDELQSQA